MNCAELHHFVDLACGLLDQNDGDLHRRHIGHAFARGAKGFKSIAAAAICHRFVNFYFELGFLHPVFFLCRPGFGSTISVAIRTHCHRSS
jgi:hypothetical protein